MSDASFELLVRQARLRAAELQPFLAVALFAMHPVAQPSLGTVAVDRHWRLYVDPAVFAGWAEDARAGALLHEVTHLVRAHHERYDCCAEERPMDPRRWNIACDLAINDDLLAAGVELPAGVVTPERVGLPPFFVEERYDELLTRQPEPGLGEEHEVPGPSCGGGSAVDGEPRPFEVGDDSAPTVDEAAAEWVRRSVAQAVAEAADRGDVPGGWARWVSASMTPTVDWRRELTAVLRRCGELRAGGSWSTWRRLPRRPSLDPSVLRPARAQPAPEIAIIQDTSGSMGHDELSWAGGEVDQLVRQLGLTAATVVVADAAVHDTRRVRTAAAVELRGGGGTDLRPAIEHAARTKPSPDAIVVLTDGYTPWPRQPVGRPVIAVLTSRTAPEPPPWITTVHIEPTSSRGGR